jgi:hypothetical protein
MIDVSVNTDDINKILIDIADLKKYTEDQLEKEFATTASLISKRAKIDAPYDTGFLKSSINFGKDKSVYVQASASYAYFQEFGWKTRGKKSRKIKGRKYFYPNAEIEIRLLFNKLQRDIDKIIK